MQLFSKALKLLHANMTITTSDDLVILSFVLGKPIELNLLPLCEVVKLPNSRDHYYSVNSDLPLFGQSPEEVYGIITNAGHAPKTATELYKALASLVNGPSRMWLPEEGTMNSSIPLNAYFFTLSTLAGA